MFTFDAGKKLRELREKKGLSLEALEMKCGVTRQTISQYENNIHSPNLDKLYKILEGLEVTPAKFFIF